MALCQGASSPFFMVRFLLIRHGTTDLLGRVLYGRMPGVHLNAEGCKQSQLLGDALKKRYRITAVISSPLERTLETARYVAAAHSLEPATEEGLIEIDFGSWTGKSFSELAALEEWGIYNRFRSMTGTPGGELMMQVQARAWAAVEKIAERHQSEENATIAIVTHGDVVRALLVFLLAMPLDYIHRIEVAPASVSEVVLETGNPRVLSMNQVFYCYP
jgi:broad specificity phosphatase PhoE